MAPRLILFSILNLLAITWLPAQNYDYDRGLTAQEWVKKDLQIFETLALPPPIGPVKEVWIVTDTWNKSRKGRPWTGLSSWNEKGQLVLDQTPSAIAEYFWDDKKVRVKYRNLETSELNGTIEVKLDSKNRPLTADRFNFYDELLTKTKWTYDNSGNITLFEVYDEMDNLLEVHSFSYFPGTGVVKSLETMNDQLENHSYGFDPQGNCLYSKGDYESITWIYDGKGRVKEIQKDEAKDLGKHFSHWTMKYSAQTGLLDRIDYQQDKVVEIRTYEHNPRGQVIKKSITRDSKVYSTNYTYNDEGRLIKEEGDFYKITTAWDKAGNWKSQKYETRPNSTSPWEVLRQTTRDFDYY